jgi:hypothetical protein
MVTSQKSISIIISGEIDPKVTTTSRNVLVTINLVNSGNISAQGLDIQVVSSGFTTTSQKRWPDNIYPSSSLSGQYILQPSTTGTFPVFASATYTTNDTTHVPNEIRQMVSKQKIGDVTVQTDPILSWSSAWAGVPTTILGTVIGFVITKATDYFTSKRMETRERKQKTELAKSYVLNWLETNEIFIKERGHAQFGKTWDGLSSVYEFIPENLRDRIRKLYVELRSYANSQNKDSLSQRLCTEISEALLIAKEWNS